MCVKMRYPVRAGVLDVGKDSGLKRRRYFEINNTNAPSFVKSLRSSQEVVQMEENPNQFANPLDDEAREMEGPRDAPNSNALDLQD